MLPQPPSQPEQAQARANTHNLKIQVVKRVGAERAQRYFGYLSRLLSNKLSKPEFNKLCLLTLGRENLPLHNQLVKSILKNVLSDKAPSAPPDNGHSVPGPPNGDFLPPSPRKSRPGVRRIGDRPSPLGSNGGADVAPHQPLPPRDAEGAAMENGGPTMYDLKRPMQHQVGGLAEQPAKRPQLSHHGLDTLRTKEVVVAKEREEAGQRGDFGALCAPLGIPFCSASMGGTQRLFALSASSGFGGNYEDGELCHTEVLRRRMEAIAQIQGLSGVSLDCANILNTGLDVYLKGLIRSCRELVGARSGHEPVKQKQQQQPIYKQQAQMKPINGVWLGNHMHVQSGAGPSEMLPEPRNHYSMSLQDFRVAMELNPRQLGEDWPLLLEKICLSSFEE